MVQRRGSNEKEIPCTLHNITALFAIPTQNDHRHHIVYGVFKPTGMLPRRKGRKLLLKFPQEKPSTTTMQK